MCSSYPMSTCVHMCSDICAHNLCAQTYVLMCSSYPMSTCVHMCSDRHVLICAQTDMCSCAHVLICAQHVLRHVLNMCSTCAHNLCAQTDVYITYVLRHMCSCAHHTQWAHVFICAQTDMCSYVLRHVLRHVLICAHVLRHVLRHVLMCSDMCSCAHVLNICLSDTSPAVSDVTMNWCKGFSAVDTSVKHMDTAGLVSDKHMLST
mgnify:CR=1 FL=1